MPACDCDIENCHTCRLEARLERANELLKEARSALSYAYEQRGVKDIAHTLSKLNEYLKGV